MIIIAHRALLEGPNKVLENRPDMVDKAFSEGFDVELDVWYKKDGDKRFWLGHDRPQYQLKKAEDWFLTEKNSNKFWLHAKSIDAYIKLYSISSAPVVKIFWHQTDDYASVTHTGYVWTFPGIAVPPWCGIMVMPEWNLEGDILNSKEFEKKILKAKEDGVAGICTDYPLLVREILTPKQLTYQGK